MLMMETRKHEALCGQDKEMMTIALNTINAARKTQREIDIKSHNGQAMVNAIESLIQLFEKMGSGKSNTALDYEIAAYHKAGYLGLSNRERKWLVGKISEWLVGSI